LRVGMAHHRAHAEGQGDEGQCEERNEKPH
jgi:hypothetical protein